MLGACYYAMHIMFISAYHNAARSDCRTLTGWLQHIYSRLSQLNGAWRAHLHGSRVRAGFRRHKPATALAVQQLPRQRPPGMQQHCTDWSPSSQSRNAAEVVIAKILEAAHAWSRLICMHFMMISAYHHAALSCFCVFTGWLHHITSNDFAPQWSSACIPAW